MCIISSKKKRRHHRPNLAIYSDYKWNLGKNATLKRIKKKNNSSAHEMGWWDNSIMNSIQTGITKMSKIVLKNNWCTKKWGKMLLTLKFSKLINQFMTVQSMRMQELWSHWRYFSCKEDMFVRSCEIWAFGECVLRVCIKLWICKIQW